MDGSFPATSPELRTFRGRLVNENSKRFEGKVAEAFEGDERFVVVRGTKKFAKRHMTGSDGNQLGDVDVLIAVPANRRLIAVEAKDMAGSLTPSDLASQLATTFGTGTKERSSGEKHARRIAWLVEHRAEVLSARGPREPSPRRTATRQLAREDRDDPASPSSTGAADRAR